jgi:hypothetical protein
MSARPVRTVAGLATCVGLLIALTGCASGLEATANDVMQAASDGDSERLSTMSTEEFELSELTTVAFMENAGCDWGAETVTSESVTGTYSCSVDGEASEHGVTFSFGDDGKLSSVDYEEGDDAGYSTD